MHIVIFIQLYDRLHINPIYPFQHNDIARSALELKSTKIWLDIKKKLSSQRAIFFFAASNNSSF